MPKFVSLRDWIDSRVGGEIELVPSEVSSEVFLGIRGEIDQVALQRAIEGLKVSKRRQQRDKGEKGEKGDRGGKGGRRDRGDRRRDRGKGGGKDGEGPGFEPFNKRRRM